MALAKANRFRPRPSAESRLYRDVAFPLGGRRSPIVLGPYIARWPEQTLLDEPAVSGSMRASARSVKRAIAAAQQHFAHSLLLTTPAAASRLVHAWTTLLSHSELLPHGIDSELFSPMEDRHYRECI